ncbi:MAG: dockerin type I domain-containing protein, partial [Planctomycetota bacterium]
LSGGTSSKPQGLVRLGSQIFFTALTSNGQRELFKSNGTIAGTGLVHNLGGSISANPNQLTVSGGKVFFTARSSATQRELFVTTGSSASTQLVKNINGGASADPKQLTDAGGQLAFTAITGGQRELFKSDGTNAGTGRIKDLSGGTASIPEDLRFVGNRLYFSAIVSNGQREMHVSDLTVTGTRLFKNLSGSVSAAPESFTRAPAGVQFGGGGNFNAADAVIPGDANGDGVVSSLDALEVIRILALSQYRPGSSIVQDPIVFNGVQATSDSVDRFHSADVNHDGIVSPIDALEVIRILTERQRADVTGERVLAADTPTSGKITAEPTEAEPLLTDAFFKTF